MIKKYKFILDFESSYHTSDYISQKRSDAFKTCDSYDITHHITNTIFNHYHNKVLNYESIHV